MTSDRSIERHFSRAAEIYHREASVQRAAARRLADEIASLPRNPRRILDIGCGTGFLTREVAERFPTARVEGVDLSLGAVAFARQQLDDLPNVEVNVADALAFTSPEPFDLIVSSSSLQWLRPFETLFGNVRGMLATRGDFCLTGMLEGTLGELHALRRQLFPDNPPRQPLPAHSEVLGALQKSGFRVNSSELVESKQEHSSAREFFRSIRSQGLTGGPLSAGAHMLTRGEIERLVATYQDRYQDAQGRVPASYRYGIYSAQVA
ncbi:MAG: methyltransferase domain-containing protein [Planctomycetales bacterium]|nr:methyltransferase domain-containing protein [Planctomycetales bacterium]